MTETESKYSELLEERSITIPGGGRNTVFALEAMDQKTVELIENAEKEGTSINLMKDGDIITSVFLNFKSTIEPTSEYNVEYVGVSLNMHIYMLNNKKHRKSNERLELFLSDIKKIKNNELPKHKGKLFMSPLTAIRNNQY